MQHGISMESALHLLQVQTSITQLWWGLLSTLVVILPSDISLCERHHRYPLAAATAKSNHACEFSDHNAHRVAFLSRRPMLSLQSLGICNNVSAASHLSSFSLLFPPPLLHPPLFFNFNSLHLFFNFFLPLLALQALGFPLLLPLPLFLFPPLFFLFTPQFSCRINQQFRSQFSTLTSYLDGS